MFVLPEVTAEPPAVLAQGHTSWPGVLLVVRARVAEGFQTLLVGKLSWLGYQMPCTGKNIVLRACSVVLILLDGVM